MNPDLPVEFYESMLAGLKRAFPEVHLHAFSPPEFVEFVAVLEIDGFPTPGVGRAHELASEIFEAKLERILERFVAAGLDSIPGGGGEILAAHVRDRIGLGKATGEQWLAVMRAAHRVGLNTSATMMFGHSEGVRDRIDHMARIRDEQDRGLAEARPGRYLSFISWPFQPENTPLGRLPRFDPGTGEPFPGDVLAETIARGEIDPGDRRAWREAVPEAGRMLRLAGASEYLRVQAIARLFLDNVEHIGSSWVTMGPHVGQMGLVYGADDMGSVMMEENVVSAAGTTYCLDEAVLCRLIREAGYVPAERDNAYRHLAVHDGPDAPDRVVNDWSHHRASALAAEGPGAEDASAPVALSVRGSTPGER
jgi:cyclic dehypoxanthinyl futalosine synthase